MIEILVKLIIVAVCVIVFGAFYREEWRRLRNAEREYDAFEQRRVDRRAAVIARDQELAKRCLMETAAQIHFVGEIK